VARILRDGTGLPPSLGEEKNLWGKVGEQVDVMRKRERMHHLQPAFGLCLGKGNLTG